MVSVVPRLAQLLYKDFPSVAHIRSAFRCQGTVGSQNDVVLLQSGCGGCPFRAVINKNLHETFSGLAFNFVLPSSEHNEPPKARSQKRTHWDNNARGAIMRVVLHFASWLGLAAIVAMDCTVFPKPMLSPFSPPRYLWSRSFSTMKETPNTWWGISLILSPGKKSERELSPSFWRPLSTSVSAWKSLRLSLKKAVRLDGW